MKKLFKILLAIVLLLIPVTLFAQTTEPGSGFDIMSLFTSFAGFGTGVLIITGLITTYLLKKLSTVGKSITSWIIAVIVGFIGWYLQLGIFLGIEWYNVFIIVASFAAGSNVIYNVEWVRNMLIWLKIVPTKVVK